MIRPGEEWGEPTSATPDVEVSGSDADLAATVAGRPGVLARFRPDASSDLGRAVGIHADGAAPTGVAVALDLLQIRDRPVAAANMIIVGVPVDRLGRFVRRFGAAVHVDGKPVFHGPCTSVVIATGQFLRGLDVVPRGHPGDGRAEVQVYAIPGRERRLLRNRLATGTHVPHPRITQRSGAHVAVSIDRRVGLEIDCRAVGKVDAVDIEVVPNAYRLLL